MDPTAINQISLSWMPDGKGGVQPVPDILTMEEAIRYLRLDEQPIRNPSKSLWEYRRKNLLRAVQIGKRVLFPRRELERFIQNQQEAVPR